MAETTKKETISKLLESLEDKYVICEWNGGHDDGEFTSEHEDISWQHPITDIINNHLGYGSWALGIDVWGTAILDKKNQRLILDICEENREFEETGDFVEIEIEVPELADVVRTHIECADWHDEDDVEVAILYSEGNGMKSKENWTELEMSESKRVAHKVWKYYNKITQYYDKEDRMMNVTRYNATGQTMITIRIEHEVKVDHDSREEYIDLSEFFNTKNINNEQEETAPHN